MPEAKKPIDEDERLEALRRFDILDTPAEERFDSLTRLTALLVDTPVALISLIDEHRQWFKSHHGLPVCETPRSYAFCGYVVLENEAFVVEDAANHPLVMDNPLVTGEPHIRFYVGVPLRSPDNKVIGSLCAIDFTPRTIAPWQIDALQTIANQVMAQMELQCTVRQVQQQNEALQLTHKEVEAASRAKSAFMRSVSHELRTPMNSIIGFSQRLIRSLQDKLSDRDFDALQTVERNALHLHRLLSEVLEISEIDGAVQTLQKNQFILDQTIETISSPYRERCREKNLAFELTMPDSQIIVLADKEKIQRSLQHILDNATRFTDRGKVSISVTCDDRAVAICIQDTGIGFSPDTSNSQTTIPQEDYTERHYCNGGIGLGLALTQKYTEQHGGTLSVESRKQNGTLVTISLPIVVEQTVKEPNPPLEPALQSNNLRLLCVDDDPDTRKFLRLTAEDEGYDVLVASDCREALQLAMQEIPDVICLDLMLPDETGMDFLASLTKTSSIAHIPVVIVSSFTDIIKAEGIPKLQKPVDAQELLTVLHETLLEPVAEVLLIECTSGTGTVQSLFYAKTIPFTHAPDGASAIELLSKQTFSAIVLNVELSARDASVLANLLTRQSISAPLYLIASASQNKHESLRNYASCSLVDSSEEVKNLIPAMISAAHVRKMLLAKENSE